jgi:hypothetical protein
MTCNGVSVGAGVKTAEIYLSYLTPEDAREAGKAQKVAHGGGLQARLSPIDQ